DPGPRFSAPSTNSTPPALHGSTATALADLSNFDNCNHGGYVMGLMRTSCRFAMAVHVLTVLTYEQGDCVTAFTLARSVNTNPVIIRRLLLALQRAKLVETRKGAGAGSRLCRSPARINLRDAHRAVERHALFY